MNRYTDIVEAATGQPFRDGNDLTVLQNGDQIFPAMLEAIQGAERRIEFLSYIYWNGRIGMKFANALAERARAGVEVRLLVDAFGAADMGVAIILRLKLAGVKLGLFRPANWPHLRRFNHRTHRKILLVDGHTGFTGGVGIGDVWNGSGQDRHHWRETHCRITGPACQDLFRGFAESWTEATGEQLSALPAPVASGRVSVHTTISTAGAGPNAMTGLLTAVFQAATTKLWITSAYFVPTETVTGLLTAAAARGVDVRVLTNGSVTDHRVTWLAGRASYHRLLRSGVKLYEHQATMHHAKVITADGAWATLGSTNLDARSLSLNDELNVSVVEPGVIAGLDDQFLRDLTRARQISDTSWLRRGRLERAGEAAASLFRHQL